MKKMYCLVVTDDYSRFSWVLFLATKDETSGILKSFITGVENLIEQRVKVIRCDNGSEFKIERKNRTLIEAARTMLADSKPPTTFWAEAVNIACYVQNRVLVTKPHTKTPYELFLDRKLALGFIRPFGCPVTILNTIDHLGKFDGKADEGFFVKYSINRSGPNWLFDIDALTKSINYKPVVTGNQSNGNAGTKACDDTGKARMKIVLGKDYILLPLWPTDLPFSQNSKSSPDAGFKPLGDNEKKVTEEPRKEGGDLSNDQEKEDDNVNNTNNVNITSDGNNTNNVNVVSSTVNAAGIEVNVVGAKTSIELPDDPNMPELEDIVYSNDDEDVGTKANMNNLNTFMHVSPIPTIRIHKDHPVEQIIRDLNSAPQTRRMTNSLEEHGLFSLVQQRTNHKDFQNCFFACFLSQEEPKKVIHALKDPSWIEAMQEELLQFKLQEVCILVDLPNRKRVIGTKWVFIFKKDERGIVIKNKARLMDVKSALLYVKIEEEEYVCQPLGFEDPDFPDRKSLCTEFEKMMHKKFQMSSMGELTFFLGLQVKQKNDGNFISQDKYVTEILKKFGFTNVKTTSTPMETQKPLLKDEDGEEVYLKGQPKLGLWYLKDSHFDLVAYTNSDYAGASLDRKSTTGDCKQENKKSLPFKKRAILFQQLLEKRRKHFAAKRAEEKRNRPPTRAQQRSIMYTYLKNMA
ncbi:putative ribonuclease H-like domain-containing protein [Tanacetum coccineum]